MHRFITVFICAVHIVPVRLYDEIESFDAFEDDSVDLNTLAVYPRIYDPQHYNQSQTENKFKIVNLSKWVLVLQNDHNIFPHHRSEWITSNGTRYNDINECEYKSGYVSGFVGSSAAITICQSDVTGFFTLGSEMYFIEPTNMHAKHIVRKKEIRFKRSNSDQQWKYFNLTGDTLDIKTDQTNRFDLVNNAMLDEKNVVTEYNIEPRDSEEIGYFFDSAWQLQLTRRKNGATHINLPPRWLEIAIAVDHTVIAFHGRKMVEQYVLTLMNIVNAIYKDPSLDANINLVVTRLILYEHKRHFVVRPGNAKKSLENANIWNRGLHLSLAPGETHHDIAVWLTRSDIGGPSGYAPVSGACDAERSCALNRDEGLSSAFIIAHEMAHILGMSHDGDKNSFNDCGDEALQGSVMAPMVSATFSQFLWSSCSKKEFEKSSAKWTCLLNVPSNIGTIRLNSTLQTAFSMDEQCRMEFGDGYTLCRAFDIVEPCTHLWCGHKNTPLVCKTKKGPPLEGTECGFDKWCVNGYCENVDKNRLYVNPVQYNPQDGGWSDWAPWGPCSRTCGTGIEFRVRKCDNPMPIYGGSDCFGSKEEWRICSIKPCPEPIRDIRAQQCKRLPRFLKLKPPKANMTWLPYESEQYDMKCKLICTSKESKEPYVTGENLIDGTPCSYENRSNICIQGICQPLGCDKKLFSTKQEDRCGVCGGDNTECTKIKSKFSRKLRRDMSRIAVLPRFAREINMTANFTVHSDSDPNIAFILKDRKRKFYSITIPNTSTSNQIIEGTKFYYRKLTGTHQLWAQGPILSEIVVLVYTSSAQIESGLNISFLSKYYLHKSMTDVNGKYGWIIGGWGPCSQTCGGGKRYKTKACFDNYNKKIVPRKHCSLITKPQLQSEKCNDFSCNFRWTPGKWEPCSATCGSFGEQLRELYCFPQSVIDKSQNLNSSQIDEPWKFMVNPNECGDASPTNFRSCYRRPCPSYWEYGEWSQCSSSCGMGVSVRHSYCAPLENETSYTCEDFAPLQRKICKAEKSKKKHPICRKKRTCLRDISKYCSFAELTRYCKIGSFRKMCCKTCNLYRLTPFIH